MVDSDVEELLLHSRGYHKHAVRLLPSAQPSRLSTTTTTHSPGDRFTVVYNRQFDRFFLQEQSPPHVQEELVTATAGGGDRGVAKSPRRQGQRAPVAVQWEDLLLPPRSVTKRTTNVLTTPVGKSDEISRSSSTQEITTPSTSRCDVASTQESSMSLASDASSSSPGPAAVEGKISSPEGDQPVLLTATTAYTDSSAGTTPPLPATAAACGESMSLVVSAVGTAEEQLGTESQLSGPANDLAALETTATEQHPQPPENAIVVSPEVAVENKPVSRTSEACISSSLRLDLSKLSPREKPITTSPSAKSPMRRRKSPTKKNRLAAATSSFYQRHFETAASAHLVSVQDQDEHEIRWQGDVIHVSVATASALGPHYHHQPPALKHSQLQQQASSQQPLTHLYSLRDLARIRPHADGYRHVNGACTFTELTSSSSSSSSEEDEEEKVALQAGSDSSSSAEEPIDPYATFAKGDYVLFQARHRWQKGTILKRIHKSWFYDLRSANGTIFEAIPARRIRLCDPPDDPQQVFEFEEGDRVLWCPPSSDSDDTDSKKDSNTSNNKARNMQTYKARIISKRTSSSSSSCSASRRRQRPRTKENDSLACYLYTLELRTGRLVKRVPHSELQPLHY